MAIQIHKYLVICPVNGKPAAVEVECDVCWEGTPPRRNLEIRRVLRCTLRPPRFGCYSACDLEVLRLAGC